jgi:hypothetical protein
VNVGSHTGAGRGNHDRLDERSSRGLRRAPYEVPLPAPNARAVAEFPPPVSVVKGDPFRGLPECRAVVDREFLRNRATASEPLTGFVNGASFFGSPWNSVSARRSADADKAGPADARTLVIGRVKGKTFLGSPPASAV